jgi:hypothetical protein
MIYIIKVPHTSPSGLDVWESKEAITKSVNAEDYESALHELYHDLNAFISIENQEDLDNVRAYPKTAHKAYEVRSIAEKIEDYEETGHYFFYDSEDSESITAIEKKSFELIPVSDTYSEYSQSVSASDAGDYFILDEDSANLLNNHEDYDEWFDKPNHYCEGDTVSAYDSREQFDILEKISDLQAEKETVVAYNYHDGHNWCTILADDSIIDSELEDRLEQAIESMEYSHNGTGTTVYVAYGYKIVNSVWQGAVGLGISPIELTDVCIEYEQGALEVSGRVYQDIWVTAYIQGNLTEDGYKIVISSYAPGSADFDEGIRCINVTHNEEIVNTYDLDTNKYSND